MGRWPSSVNTVPRLLRLAPARESTVLPGIACSGFAGHRIRFSMLSLAMLPNLVPHLDPSIHHQHS